VFLSPGIDRLGSCFPYERGAVVQRPREKCAILMNKETTLMANVTLASAEQGVMRRRLTLPLRHDCRSPPGRIYTRKCSMTGSRGALHFIACRVLGGTEGAELAVLNCWLRASRNPPTFDREGAFRSWLLRILIDEASTFL
jgi:hypothetical protein